MAAGHERLLRDSTEAVASTGGRGDGHMTVHFADDLDFTDDLALQAADDPAIWLALLSVFPGPMLRAQRCPKIRW